MNWLDLALVLIIGILLFVGIKKGFMTSVLSHFSLTMNAILSFFLCKPFALFYNKIGVYDAIANKYSSNMIDKSADFAKNLLDIPKSNLRDFVENTIDKGFSGIPNKMFDWFLNKPSLYKELHNSGVKSRTLADIISNTYANFFVNIISFVTSILILYLVVFLISKLIQKLRKNGFVKFVDTTLGAFYGLFKCFLLLIIVCSVIKLISPFSFMTSVTTYIEDSFFGNLIYGQISSFIDNYLGFKDIINAIFK